MNILRKTLGDKEYLPIPENEDEIFCEYYNRALYQIIGDIIEKQKLKMILSCIKNGKILWEHQSYNEIKK